MTASRRILLASYHFPPAAAVGGLRTARLARLLPEAGWEPYVLTVKDDLRDDSFDPQRMHGLEQVPVVRTGELPRAVEALWRLKAVLRGKRRLAAPPVRSEQHPGAPTSRETLERRLTRYVVSLLWALPDTQKNWALAAAPRAARLVRQHGISWVFTSGPPFSTHVIGLVTRLLTGARWIADFRDPWMEILDERRPDARSLASDRIERWMEGSVARFADRVLTTTEPLRAAMIARYPSVPAEKFVCIPNGFETAPAADEGSPGRFAVFTITYAGSLYYDRTPEPLFRAVVRLIAAGAATARDIRIKLIGECRDADGVSTRALIERYGLGEVVELIDRIPYADALRIMRRSHLLLVLAPERHRLVIPAKIFDYLATGSAILALAPAGATAELIAQTRCGACFPDDDVDGLTNYLSSLLDDGAFRRLGNDPAAFPQFDARHLVHRFASELEYAGGNMVRNVAAGA